VREAIACVRAASTQATGREWLARGAGCDHPSLATVRSEVDVGHVLFDDVDLVELGVRLCGVRVAFDCGHRFEAGLSKTAREAPCAREQVDHGDRVSSRAGRNEPLTAASGVSCKSVFSCFEDIAGVGPLERRGGLVVGLDEREHLFGQILLACEDAVLEQPPPSTSTGNSANHAAPSPYTGINRSSI
jgi:hypothetical protein